MTRAQRVTRRLLNLLTALSLLLCVAVAAAWLHGRDHMTSLVLRRVHEPGGGDRASALCCVHGGLYFMTHRRKPTEGGRPATWIDQEVGPAAGPHFFDTPDFAACGFEFNRPKGNWGPDAPGYLRVPLWCLFATPALAPAARTVLWRRRRAASATGRCLSCGYDLRATPGRCPECGTATS